MDNSNKFHSWLIYAITAIISILLISCNGGKTNSQPTVQLKSINITTTNASIANGTITMFNAIGIYSNDTTADITNKVSWSSSDTNVATINDSGILSAKNSGSSNIVASLSGISSNIQPVTVTNASLISLNITTTNASFAKGFKSQIVAKGIFSDSTTQDLTTQVSWNSSDTNIASIDNNGIVTGLLAGSTNINASFGSVISNQLPITITNATLTAIRLTTQGSNPSSFAAGYSSQLQAIGIFSDNTTHDLTEQHVTWSSSNSDIVLVDAAGNATGIKAGNAAITATYGDISSNQLTLNITDADLVSITLNTTAINIPLGFTAQLTATGTFSDHTTHDITTQVAWISTDPSVANVDSNGLVSADSEGSANISAELFGGISSTPTPINVADAKLVSIQLTSAYSTIAKGTATQLTATGTFDNGNTFDITQDVALVSSNPASVSISNSGLATGDSVGSSEITADIFGGIQSASITVNVTDATLEKIIINVPDASLAKGTQTQATATGIFSDTSHQILTNDVYWDSSDSAVANISGNGTITTTNSSIGTTNITADQFGGLTSNTLEVTVIPATIATITVAPTSGAHQIVQSNSAQFIATAILTDGSTQTLSNATWTSSNSANVSIDTSGLAKAVKSGTADITAIAGGITSTPWSLDVTNPSIESITIALDQGNLVKGTKSTITATAHYNNGTTQDISNDVIWHSTDTNVATIIPGKSFKFPQVSANGAGTADITATMSGFTSNIEGVSVSFAQLTSLQVYMLDNPTASLPLGVNGQMQAIGTFSDNTTQDMTGQVAWTSSNQSIVNVASNGSVSANNTIKGTSSITAMYNGITGSQTVTAADAKLTSIKITTALSSVFTNSTSAAGAVKATGTYSNNTQVDITEQVSWYISPPNLHINKDGSITASEISGTANITASLSGTTSNQININVIKPSLVSITASADPTTNTIGGTGKFILMGTYENGETREMNYYDRTQAQIGIQIIGGSISFVNTPEIFGYTGVSTGEATIYFTDYRDGITINPVTVTIN